MSDAVSILRPVSCDDEPDQDVIDVLRGMLARAESGDLRAVGVAGVTRTGAISTHFDTGGEHCISLLAAATVLRRRVEDLLSGDA